MFNITLLLEFMTLASHIFIILFLISLIPIFNKLRFVKFSKKQLVKYSLFLTFLVALASTLGSLYYSEILNYPPCKLCWFQRIFMYPMVILLGISLYKKQDISDYIVLLAIPGAVLAGFHHILQVFFSTSSCPIDPVVPCNIAYNFAYGYITIPVMALTGFILIILFTLLDRK